MRPIGPVRHCESHGFMRMGRMGRCSMESSHPPLRAGLPPGWLLSVEQRPVFGERRHPSVRIQSLHQLGLEAMLKLTGNDQRSPPIGVPLTVPILAPPRSKSSITRSTVATGEAPEAQAVIVLGSLKV